MTDTPRIAAGFDYLYYFTLDSSGRIKGHTANGAANGTIEGARRLEGGRTIPFTINEDETITVTGNNKPLVSFSFPSGELPSGVMETAVNDMGFNALAQGTKIRNQADFAFSGRGSGEVSRPDIGLLVQRQAKTWEDGSRGNSAWEGQLALKTNITPLGAPTTERQFDPYRYSLNLSGSDRYSWGASFTEVADGFTNTPIVDIESDNPIHLAGGYGDGVTVAFTLDYAPKATTKMIVTLDGVVKLLTTHYTVSNKTLTFGVAPGNGVHIGVFYEVTAADLS